MTAEQRANVARVRRRLLYVALGLALVALGLTRGVEWYFDPRPRNAANHVIVYTTRWCPVCERLRICFRRHQVHYEERDVDASWRFAQEWTAAGGIGVPLTLLGSETAHGLRREQLEPLMARAGYSVDCWNDDVQREAAESLRARVR